MYYIIKQQNIGTKNSYCRDGFRQSTAKKTRILLDSLRIDEFEHTFNDHQFISLFTFFSSFSCGFLLTSLSEKDETKTKRQAINSNMYCIYVSFEGGNDNYRSIFSILI